MKKENGHFFLKVDSDALLIRGVLSIYVYLLDGRPMEEIAEMLDAVEKYLALPGASKKDMVEETRKQLEELLINEN